MAEDKISQGTNAHQGEPFYPHELLRFGVAFFVFLAVLLSLAIFLPREVLPPADPMNTPEHIKPEWYFLASYQMLKLIPNEIAGLTIQGLLGLAVLLLPFWEKSRRRHPIKRPLFTPICIAIIVLFIVMTFWGKYS
jgi:ubiquinol-cytochrome c reductase cytochrome b subunit